VEGSAGWWDDIPEPPEDPAPPSAPPPPAPEPTPPPATRIATYGQDLALTKASALFDAWVLLHPEEVEDENTWYVLSLKDEMMGEYVHQPEGSRGWWDEAGTDPAESVEPRKPEVPPALLTEIAKIANGLCTVLYVVPTDAGYRISG